MNPVSDCIFSNVITFPTANASLYILFNQSAVCLEVGTRTETEAKAEGYCHVGLIGRAADTSRLHSPSAADESQAKAVSETDWTGRPRLCSSALVHGSSPVPEDDPWLHVPEP